MAAAISTVIMNGNSQAVRIPQDFRLNVYHGKKWPGSIFMELRVTELGYRPR